MSVDDDKVLLDLNYPAFQSELFELDAPELKKIIKIFKKLRGMSWNDVFKDRGLKWEAPKSTPGKFTIRRSQSYRAIVVRADCWMRFQTLLNWTE